MRRYVEYKRALEKMGLRQLDVYRAKDHDEVRALRLQDKRVFLIRLPKHREEMGLEEFVELVRRALS